MIIWLLFIIPPFLVDVNPDGPLPPPPRIFV